MQVTVKKYFLHPSLGLVPLFIVQERSIITTGETTQFQPKILSGDEKGGLFINPSTQSSVTLTNTRTLTLVVVYRS